MGLGITLLRGQRRQQRLARHTLVFLQPWLQAGVARARVEVGADARSDRLRAASGHEDIDETDAPTGPRGNLP
jgi:hypothetical protein